MPRMPFHSSKLMSANGVCLRTDALTTSMSRRPKRLTAPSTIALTALASATSATKVSASPPMALISFTIASPASRETRELTATFAPPAASASAIERPMLRVAPVTSATLPLNSLPGCKAASWIAIRFPPVKKSIVGFAAKRAVYRTLEHRVLPTAAGNAGLSQLRRRIDRQAVGGIVYFDAVLQLFEQEQQRRELPADPL